jgi:hypothetical protein
MSSLALSLVFVLFFLSIIGIFFVICYWKIFTKAGMPGWASLVPIYNLYVYTKILKRPSWWIVIYFVPNLISLVLSTVINSMPDMIFLLLAVSIILYIGILVLGIIDMVKLAKVFGQDSGFAVGLIFLSFIFIPILAFGSAEYEKSNTSSGELLD